MNTTARLGFGAVVALVGALGMIGCTSTPKKSIVLTPLDCSVAGQKPKVLKKAITGATIEIPVRAINNNPIAVKLDQLALDATINGTSIGSCEPVRSLQIGSGETANLRLIYHVSTIGGGIGVVDALATGNITLEAAGNGHIVAAEPGYVGDKDFPLQLK
ncbi:MAG: hypothetical protein ACAI25_06705 [Planctomycetota bacterium]